MKYIAIKDGKKQKGRWLSWLKLMCHSMMRSHNIYRRTKVLLIDDKKILDYEERGCVVCEHPEGTVKFMSWLKENGYEKVEK